MKPILKQWIRRDGQRRDGIFSFDTGCRTNNDDKDISDSQPLSQRLLHPKTGGRKVKYEVVEARSGKFK